MQTLVINLLSDLQCDFRLSYLLVAHDLAVVRHISHFIAVTYLGKIVEIAQKTRALHPPAAPGHRDATLDRAGRRSGGPEGADYILKRDMQSPIDPSASCPFHTRCSYAFARCSVARRISRKSARVGCHLHEFQTTAFHKPRGSRVAEERGPPGPPASRMEPPGEK